MPCKTDAARAELVRLASFSKWPMDATMMQVSLVRLAAAGFLYTGDSDGVVCSYCDEVVRGWLGTRCSPDVEHSCASDHAAPRDVRAPSATDPSRAETVGRCRSTVPGAEAVPRSGDVATRGSTSAADRHHNVSTERRLEGDEVRRPAVACVASSSLSRHSVDNVAHSTSGDVRDSATANFSKST